jgi:AcrR family transcriptional regulator
MTTHPRRGGRTANITRRIHDATLALLVEGGHSECTFQNVARRAGIERSTLYRRYPSRWAMLVEAWAARFSAGLNIAPTDSFAADIRAHVRRVANTLNSPLGMAMVAAGAVARLDPDAQVTAGGFWKSRLAQQEPFVAAAVARGELAADVDREALFAAADGPLYFRLLIVGRPIDDALIEKTARGVEVQFCLTASSSEKETAS